MLNALHDQIDFEEDLRERARVIVDAMRPEITSLVKETGDTRKAMEMIAAIVADELTELTTEAVQTSARFAEGLSKKARR